MTMDQVTQNVFVETKIRGCNPSIVLTREGSVFIDTAQWISKILEMREFALQRGPIRYLINTHSHLDHIFGNHWFAGESIVIGHEKINETFWTATGELDCYDLSVDILIRQDPNFLNLMPTRENYIVNRPQMTFSERMTVQLGDHSFNLYHTPGHAAAQLAVHVPQERIVFAGDTVYSGCQTWLLSANIDQLIQSLHFLKTLDADIIVPGHGPVTDKAGINRQIVFIYEWIAEVGKGIEKGWTLDECIERISLADRCPVDIGQDEKMAFIQRSNVIKVHQYLMGNAP
jgi:cyclase